jgi:hypothetical protein
MPLGARKRVHKSEKAADIAIEMPKLFATAPWNNSQNYREQSQKNY